MPARCVIGIDVGGTKIAGGVVLLPEGRVLARRQEPTRPERGGDAVLGEVITLVKSLLQEADAHGATPSAVGVGVAELVGPHGEVLSEATIRWRGIDVEERIQSQVLLPVVVEEDVRAAARAEASLGAGRGLSSFLYVTIGTGISSCYMIDGFPLLGARGLTGTFASARMLIPSDDGSLAAGPPLEQFAGGPALASRYGAQRNDRDYSTPEVLDLCEQGDEAARSVVTSAGRAVGAAVGHLVNVLDPEAVVIGGGLGMAGGTYRQSLEASLREHVWSDYHRDIAVLSAELGVDAGLVGAAIAATFG